MDRVTDLDELETMLAACEDAATRLRAVLDDIAAAGVLSTGAYGAKIESRITLAAERLDHCATSFRRQLSGGPQRTRVVPGVVPGSSQSG